MYAALEGAVDVSSSADLVGGDVSKVLGWVKSCVENILGGKVDIEGDLFQQGMDRFVLFGL